MSANTALLVQRKESGWRMGLANMVGKELGTWWRTRRWWVQCLVALVLLNGCLALNIRGCATIGNALEVFFLMETFLVPVAAVSLAQDSILGERHSGTAAWVLSKPIRRQAFVLAKWIAHALGLLATWVVLPGAVGYLELAVMGKVHLPVAGFAGALGLAYLNLMFYEGLALMLATLFQERGPVLGMSVGLLYGWLVMGDRLLMKYAPFLPTVMPWNLLMSVGSSPALYEYLLSGRRLPAVAPVIATVLWCAVFVAVAVWRMNREEF